MMGAFAEFERSIIRKRQAEGIAKAKERGVYKGRKASIDAREIMSLKEQGLGASAIAKQLGIGRASVYRVIQQ
jgi:DNA invertase Pin-like site-specific DNA recombinase